MNNNFVLLGAAIYIGITAVSGAYASDETPEFLIRKFAPLVKLYPEEDNLPSSINWYLDRSVLKKDHADGDSTRNPVDLIVSDNLSSPLIANYAEESYYLTPKDGIRKDTLYGEPLTMLNGQMVSPAACYAHYVEKDHGAVIQYFFFYTFNGDISWVLGKIGTHEGDWEHIDIHLEKKDGHYELSEAYYDRHGSNAYGELYNANELEYADVSHPVVYSAFHGHASYKDRFLINKVLDRTSNDGPRWRCWDNVVDLGTLDHPAPGQEWLSYGGRWGKDGNTSPARRDWWRKTADQKVFVASVITHPFSAQMRDQLSSDKFKIKGEVPKRVKKLYWRIDHPQAASMTFFVTHKNIWGHQSQVYGPLSGSGTVTPVGEQNDLYISNLTSTVEILGAPALKVIVEAVEE
jgi:hypothetical protein